MIQSESIHIYWMPNILVTATASANVGGMALGYEQGIALHSPSSFGLVSSLPNDDSVGCNEIFLLTYWRGGRSPRHDRRHTQILLVKAEYLVSDICYVSLLTWWSSESIPIRRPRTYPTIYKVAHDPRNQSDPKVIGVPRFAMRIHVEGKIERVVWGDNYMQVRITATVLSPDHR